MKITTEPRDDHQVKIVAEFETSELDKYKGQAARRIASRAKIPGFRPGKAPYDVIARLYGEPAIEEDAIEIMMEKAYPEVLDEAKISPAAPGTLENVEKGDPIKFTFVVPLEPTVDLGNYREVRKEYTPQPVTDQQVEEFIQRLRRTYATAEPVERPAETGDLVYLKLDANLTNLDPRNFQRMIEKVVAAYPNMQVVGTTLRSARTASINDWGAVSSWSWNFGDGITSTAQNPSHAYATAGTKTVTLTVRNATGSASSSRTLSVVTTLTASFTFSPSLPTAGQTVQFTDTSTGTPSSWLWNFGDGTTSTAQSPSHVYSAAGTFTVTLTAMNAAGANTTSRSVLVAEQVEPTGEVYWVSPTGAASWASARSVAPLSGAAAASLATANASAVAGDTVVLRGGVYNTGIQPAHSGTGISSKITFQAYPGETPLITGSSVIGIALNNGKTYVKVTGMTVRNVSRWLVILRGSSYNEVSYCSFEPAASLIAIQIYRGETTAAPCTHNWFHHNVIHDQGYVGDDWNDHGYLMQLGVPSYDGDSSYNTIEDNIWYHGGHHCMDTCTQYNVIRGNVMHNESWMDPPDNPTVPALQLPASNGKYGNRCFTIYDETGYNRDGLFNLAEGNRFGHAGRPPDDDGADNVELAAHKNIFRYNDIFNAAKDGLYFRNSGTLFACNNRVYNNTIYYNGQNESFDYYEHRRNGIYFTPNTTGNVIKNNISYGNYNHDIWSWYPLGLHGNTVANNWFGEGTDPIFFTPGLTGDPLFVNTDVSNPMSTTLPDLSLRSTSGAIDRGAHLTRAVQGGVNSMTLVVEDALYFQDGTWGSALSDVRPDGIAIGTVDNVVQIRSINYATNVILLAEPRTWSAQAPIWLYSDSRGRCVLQGAAPDVGAHEYVR